MTERAQVQLRLPQTLKAWLEEQARLNGSSQNSEIVRAIRERKDRVTDHPNPTQETTQ